MIRDREAGRSVRASCVALGVSVSSYYDWCDRAPSPREVEDRRLAVEVRAVYRESRQSYGARRVHAELQDRGVACGRHRIGRLMREGGLVARGPKRKPPTATPQAPLTPVAENVLDRQFAPDAPDRVWTADPAPPRRARTSRRAKAGSTSPSWSISSRGASSDGLSARRSDANSPPPRSRQRSKTGDQIQASSAIATRARNTRQPTTGHCCAVTRSSAR